MRTFYATGKISYAGAEILKNKLKSPIHWTYFLHGKVISLVASSGRYLYDRKHIHHTRTLFASFVCIYRHWMFPARLPFCSGVQNVGKSYVLQRNSKREREREIKMK
jgi:hypothetical protein